MKEHGTKRFVLTKQGIVTIILFVLSLTGMILCTVFPVHSKSATANLLLADILPRACILVPLLWVMIWRYRELLGFPRPWNRKKTLIWLLPPIAVALVNFPFSALISGTATVTQPEWIWLFAIKCLLIGIVEEWFFRGILLDLFLQIAREKQRTVFLPVLFSSLAFALFHLLNLFDGAGFGAVLLQTGYSFLIGGMLAVVFCKTRNLWISVILHTVFDAGGFLIKDLGTGNPQDLVFWILTAVVGIGCAVHIILTLVHMCKRKLR
ncbi:MAG: CPBP family intramembrane metalloprotease [Clostridia bacterium]|nr:CPBP family intramembrane metalloprotease [Clostridia bacterium]